MASRKVKEDRIDEMGETSFGNPIDSSVNPWFNPIGAFGKFFSRFFATKAQPYVATQGNPGPTAQHPIGGDAVVNDQVIKGTESSNAAGGIIRNPVIPQLEMNRKARYGQFESMDEYPEIGAAFDIYCLTGDTVVPLLNGTHRTLKDLYDSKITNFWTYSYDLKNKKMVAAICEKAIKTGIREDVLKVTFDDGTVIKSTPSHKFLSPGGIYKYAKDLKPGDSILALIRLRINSHSQNYENVLMQPWKREWKSSHRMALISQGINIPKGHIVHHKDHNGLNNNLDNLQILTKEEHDFIHDMKGDKNPRFRHDVTIDKFMEVINKGYTSISNVAKALGCSYRVINRLTKEAGYKNWGDLKKKKYNLHRKANITSKSYNTNYINHKVVSVEYYGKEDTYCLFNVGEHHNFAVGSQLEFGDALNAKFIFVANSDDSCQLDIRGRKWVIDSESKMAIEEVERCFDQIKLDRYYWDISRNMTKYGDCFLELVVDLNNEKYGIQRIKILNPNFIYRVENEYGYLTDFLQELPQRGSSDWSSFGTAAGSMGKSKFIALDKNQIVHARLHTSDPRFYPYGKGIGSLAIRIFRSLKLMEDAMIVYRLSRAPERRVFYINTGTLPASKAEAFIEKVKRRFKKDKVYSSTTGNLDEKINPLSFDEDFFIPHRGDKETRIEVLPGAQNLGEVDDVKYFRDKLLACLKIPKDYIVEFDKSPERKANLSQLDVKFAKVISRVQRDFSVALETIARRHLAIKGYPQSIINALKISLPDPSDMYTKRRLDVDGQKAQVVQQVLGLQLFSKRYIYKEYYDMSDHEIEEMKQELEQDMEEMAQNGMVDPMMGGGMPPPGGPMDGPPEQGDENKPDKPPQDNGPESRENIPPTQKEEVNKLFTKIKRQALLEGNRDKIRTITKIMTKFNKN